MTAVLLVAKSSASGTRCAACAPAGAARATAAAIARPRAPRSPGEEKSKSTCARPSSPGARRASAGAAQVADPGYRCDASAKGRGECPDVAGVSLRAPVSRSRVSDQQPRPQPPPVGRALARHLPRPAGAEGLAPDDGRGHRRGRRPHDPDRRPLAGRLRVLQLPRLRPRPRDHRGDPRLPRRLGHPPELVAAARQPGHLRGDRGRASPSCSAARTRSSCRRSRTSTCP